MNEFFLAFKDKHLMENKVLMLANDLFLTHLAFYAFLGTYYACFKKEGYEKILMNELGLSEKGSSKKYGAINNAEVWLKELNVERADLSFEHTISLKIFQKLCLEACDNEEKGEALIAAIESVGYDFMFELERALKRSGYPNLNCAEIYCNPDYDSELEQASRLQKFRDNSIFKDYKDQITLSFVGLATYFS